VTLGGEASEQVDEEVEGAAVAGVLDLADVFELINDGLDESTFAQEQLVGERQEDVAHVLAQFRDEAEALLKEELLSKRRRDVALVAKEASKQTADQAWYGLAIVEIARGEAKGEQLATVVDHHLQLEAVEPADRGLPASGIDPEDAVLLDTRGMADGEGGRVDEADARALPALDGQVDG